MIRTKLELGVLGWMAQQTAGQNFQTAYNTPMMQVVPEFEDEIQISPVFTVGENLPSSEFEGGYISPGVLDGMGAWKVDENTVRVYSNHELDTNRGFPYDICADLDCTSTYQLTGARISFFDFDVETVQIKDSGVSYRYIYGSDGTLQADSSWLDPGNDGFARFCSAQFVDANEYGLNRGIVDAIQFGPEENAQFFSAFGGHYWALDTIGRGFWRIPALGRGSWESITQIDTDTDNYVAFVMPDDTSPALINDVTFAAPLYLYVGEKDPGSDDFLTRNGLRGGTTYVWRPDDQDLISPEQFSGTGNSQPGTWAAIDTAQDPENALQQITVNVSGVEASLFLRDTEGFPTQLNLWTQANAAGAFKLSRPEDISTYSRTGNEFVLTSTGITGFNGTDSFGTIYTMELTFTDGVPDPSFLTILLDADADVNRTLRSPDNLDWADDGYVYVQEDRAIVTTPQGEQLFGNESVNRNEAQLVRINGSNPDGLVTVLAAINRSIVLDASVGPELATNALDLSAGDTGAWESTGIIEVSSLFNRPAGSLFLGNVQAHGIVDQRGFNPTSRIMDDDLVEGGQMIMIQVEVPGVGEPLEEDDDDDDDIEIVVGFTLALAVMIAVVLVVPRLFKKDVTVGEVEVTSKSEGKIV